MIKNSDHKNGSKNNHKKIFHPDEYNIVHTVSMSSTDSRLFPLLAKGIPLLAGIKFIRKQKRN